MSRMSLYLFIYFTHSEGLKKLWVRACVSTLEGQLFKKKRKRKRKGNLSWCDVADAVGDVTRSRFLWRSHWNILSWSTGLELLLLGDVLSLRVTSMQKGKKKKEEKNVPRHESQLHLMIAKGWSTCRLYCSSIVTPSTRRYHLSHQSYPALLPEHRQWVPAHHPRCYLCLTARKRKVKPVTRRCGSTAASCKQNVRVFSIAEETLAFLWTGPTTRHILHTHAKPFTLCVWVILFGINSCFEIQMSRLCSTCGEVGRSLVGALGGAVQARVLQQHSGGSVLVSGFLLILTWSLRLIRSMVLRQPEQQLSL